MTNEQLQQFFIQQAAAAAAAAAVFSSLWNGQQPPTNNQHIGGGANNQQVQSEHGDDQHDLTSPATNTGNSTSSNTAASSQHHMNTQNPLEALLANAGSPVNLAALMQNFQKQQNDSNSTGLSGFNMSDQQQATALAAAIRSSSSHSASPGNNVMNALPSALQHQLNNLISPPSNHSHNNNPNSGKQQLNSSGSTSSSPSSLANHQQQHSVAANKSQATAYHHYQNNANANTRSSANSKSISGNNQAINNQQISHNNNNNNNNNNNTNNSNSNISTSLDSNKIEVGLNMTTTALSSTPNSMQSPYSHTRAASSPITNNQAPINAMSHQHQKTSSTHHHQSSHKISTNTSREPISSSVLAKNNVGLPRKLVRGQDVWLGRGVEQTRQILKCMWCGQSCRTLADLSQHMKETQHYTNIVSQEQITSWRTPDNDLAQSQVNQVFTCKVCDEAFSSLNELSNHMIKKSHYNGQPMNSPIGSHGLIGGESNSTQIINQQHLLTTTTAIRKSPSLSNADMQSVGQINSNKRQRTSSSYNDYDNQSASPPMSSSSNKERRKKSLPVRKLLELERKSGSAVGRNNQSKNDLSDNNTGLGNQDSDCDDNVRDNSSMALMSRMLDRQTTAFTADNDHLGMSDDDTGQFRDETSSGNKGYTSHTNNDGKGKKRHKPSTKDDFDDEDDSSGNLDRSPRDRLGQSRLSPSMSDHESIHSSTSTSYKNQIHIDTSNLTPGCSDCQQKKSSCKQKCRSCSNTQHMATSSMLYKPGAVGRQLLASLMNNKLDPDQLDEDLLNKPLIYDSNGDVVINIDGRIISSQTKMASNSDQAISSKDDNDSDMTRALKNCKTGESSSKHTTENDQEDQKLVEDTSKASSSLCVKTEKNDDSKCSQIDSNNQRVFSDSTKSDTFQDTKVTKAQALSAASPSDKTSKAKPFSNTSSLSALEMLVEKSFDPKTRRGAQNTGILQRLGIDEEICPPWQHMNYASWYAAAAASYGGIPGNPMAAMSSLSGYPLPPGMPMSMSTLGNAPNSSRSHNNMTPMSGQGASMSPPLRTPSSSPPTNTSSPHSNSHHHSSHNNKSSKSMSMNPSVTNLQIEASSSPSLNSLMATTNQQLQCLTSSSMQYQSPHSSPTAASLSSTKGSSSSTAGRNNKRTMQNMQDDDLDDSPSKSSSLDNNKQASRRSASSSNSRNTSAVKGSKKAKLNDEFPAVNNCQVTSNRYPRRSKTSTTLNKLKQQLESESEDDFEDYDNEQEPVSLAMKKTTKSNATSSMQQQDFQQNQIQQLQQLQLQLQSQQLQQQQQQLPREEVNQQSLAAMQATFLLKQLMTQAMASMVTGNQVQPAPDNLASVQQYLLGSMLNQNQTQLKQTHADSMQQSKKKSVRRSFSDDIDEDDKEGLSDDGDCVDFTSLADAQQQYKQQNKSSSRGRKTTKKQACKKSSATKKGAQATSSAALIDNQQQESNQQDISRTEMMPVDYDEKYTVASSEEQDLVGADHSLLRQEKSKSSRRRKQQPKKDTDNSEADDDDINDDKADIMRQLKITGQEEDDQDHHSNCVLHDEQEVADSDNQSNRKSIIGKINVDNDLNDSTATESNMTKEKKREEGDHPLLYDGRAENHDESSGKDDDDNTDQDKNYRHHEKSIASCMKTILDQKQTVVSRNDEVEAFEGEDDNIFEQSDTGNKERGTNAQLEKISSLTAYEITDELMVNENKRTSSSTEALSSQEITDILSIEQNTNNENTGEEINTDQSNKSQQSKTANSASSKDDVEDLSASIQSKERTEGEGKSRDDTSYSVDDCDTNELEENHSSGPDHDGSNNYSKFSPSDDSSSPNKIVSNVVDEPSRGHISLGGINHDDLTSSDEDNDDDNNYLTSVSHERNQERTSKSRHNQQQQTVIGQVGKTNGDTKSILEVNP